MKSLFTLLAVTVGLAAPLSANADTVSSRTSTAATRKHPAAHPAVAAVAPVRKRSQAVWYITNREVTGSHIPLVICRYEGHDYTMSSFTTGAIYGGRALELSGALSVGGALNTLDPAISSVR